MSRTRLQVVVLGPTEIFTGGGEQIALGKPQVHRLVAALALSHPHATALDVLVERLWPGAGVPQNPRRSLQCVHDNTTVGGEYADPGASLMVVGNSGPIG